ncbi:31362_t:CDS:1, partial [Gigaspora margarita]
IIVSCILQPSSSVTGIESIILAISILGEVVINLESGEKKETSHSGSC